jgi:hypothetical protein
MCNKDKEISEFQIIKRRGKECVDTKCKLCFKEYYKKLNKKSYMKHNEKRVIEQRNYNKNNKVKVSAQRKQFRLDNNERLKLEGKETYIKNKVIISQKRKDYYQANKERILKQKNEYYKLRLKTDIVFKLRKNIKTLIKSKLVNNGYTKKSRTHEILGCSFEEFKIYLESKFESWMTWDNYGKYNGELNYGWDIDHITPISSAKTEENVLKLNHYTNLQPLCSYTNRVIKRNK